MHGFILRGLHETKSRNERPSTCPKLLDGFIRNLTLKPHDEICTTLLILLRNESLLPTLHEV